ncbi:MAG: VOC family protein, partial [Nocardioides sp.]|nr:VOC family protein [Nocardioides sp.]
CFAVAAEPVATAWFEVHNSQYDASVAFYRDAFDWNVHVSSDTDDFRYSTHGREETAYAGIMDASRSLAPDAPSRWLLYIAVRDVEATATRAAELGGSVEEAPQDTPFGRMATISDPCGVTLKLVASGPS